MPRNYVPDAGDLIWLDFSPHAGHEQDGRRPALVLSPAAYNGRTGLMLCCPLTTHVKGYPFEVIIPGEPTSVVLADQIRNLDWHTRHARRIRTVAPGALEDVRAKVRALVD